MKRSAKPPRDVWVGKRRELFDRAVSCGGESFARDLDKFVGFIWIVRREHTSPAEYKDALKTMHQSAESLLQHAWGVQCIRDSFWIGRRSLQKQLDDALCELLREIDVAVASIANSGRPPDEVRTYAVRELKTIFRESNVPFRAHSSEVGKTSLAVDALATAFKLSSEAARRYLGRSRTK
jgi:hypothetical protein